MNNATQTIGLAALLLIVGGCDAVDYYPKHESPQQSADLRKDGPGSYGGNNSNYPVGTPGTSDTAMPSATNTLPSAATPNNGPTFNINGQGTFSATGSYSGANTGGSSTANRPNAPADGTTRTGTSAGR